MVEEASIMKKILFFIFLMFMFIIDVNAEACDAYDIKRLKEIAEGVEITYELQEPFENDGAMVYDHYKIKITGLTDEIYIYDKTNKKRYFYHDSVSGNVEYYSIVPGRIDYYIYPFDCSNKLKNSSIKLPIYNIFSNSDECKNINYNIGYCDEYVDSYISYDEFINAYDEYLNKNKGYDLDKNKIIVFSGLILIVIILFVIFIMIKKKKSDLV